jgi:hypothetical protein
VIVVAVLALTAPAGVLSQLAGNDDIQVAIVRATARDNGDGTWSVVVHAGEDQIPALQGLGCTVRTLTTDAEELARFEVTDTQIDIGMA